MPIYGDKQADPVFSVEAGWVTGTDHDSRPVSLDVLHKRSSWGWTRIIMPSPLKQGLSNIPSALCPQYTPLLLN